MPAGPPNDAAIRRLALLCGIAGIGLVLLKSTIIELDWDARLAALLVGWVVTALWLPPLRIGKAPLVAAGVALGVHLLGAGGIAMPVVVATLLLLWLGPVDAVAASTDAADTDAAPGRRRALFGLMVCAVLVPACLVSSLVPVTLSSLYVAAATGAITARGDAATARRYLRNAIQADALDPQPWVYLAQLEYEAARQNRDAGSREWVNAIVQLTPAIELDPENSKSRWLLAQWKLEFAKRFPSPDAANEALQAAQQAADRDPQHAGIVATLAEAYAAANQPGEARNVAERALALDALNLELGHLDKLLDAKTRGELERIAGE